MVDPIDFSDLNATTDLLFSQACEQAFQAQESQLRDSLALNLLITPEQIEYRIQEARKQLCLSLEKFLKQQDWLLGWGLIVDYCKNSTSHQITQEWNQVPKALKEVFQSDQLDFGNLQETLRLSDASMAEAYDAAMKYYDAKDYSRTLNILACINFFNPGYFESWFLEGACHQQASDWNPAIHSYGMSLTVNPHHALPYWYIAQCYYELQEVDLGRQFHELAKQMQLPEGISVSSMENLLQPHL